MMKMIHCQKLDQELEGLPSPPFPGELGEKIYRHISQQGWQLWLDRQTMLINEYRLSTLEKKSRDFLKAEMMKFLFEGDHQAPPGFVPPEDPS